ncbi:MAG: VOC family protein [Ignavibacteriae bacterium]|nr:VOC family protein [Ignavibacteriota bacterium]
MEQRKQNGIAPSIRVKDMQKSLDFYTKTLGFQTSDKVTRKDGKVAHAAVGFDSALIMLSPAEYIRTQQTKDDLAKNKPGVGVELYIGMTASKKLDAFFSEIKGKGVTVVNEPKTEAWGDRIFTVRDPDGYALTFSEFANEVTPEARTAAFESAHQK